MVQVRLYRPFPAAALLAALPATARAGRGAGPDQGAGLAGRAAVPGRARRAGRGARRGRPGGDAGGDRRPVRAVVEGVHPGHGRRRLRRTGRASARPRFTIGITDDVSGTSLPYDPTLDIEPAGTIARGVLRPRLGRHGRREQEHHQDPRRGPAAARPGLLRLRLEEVRLADRVPPAVRAEPDPRALPGRSRPASSAATRRSCSTGSRCSTGPRPARPCCSTPRTRRSEVWDSAAPPGAGADPGQADHPVRHRRRRRWPARRAWPGGSTPCCRPASSPSPGCCRGRRRSRRSRRRSPRPTAAAGPRWSSATTPRWTGAGRAAPDRDPRPGRPPAGAAAAGAGATRPSSCARSPRR